MYSTLRDFREHPGASLTSSMSTTN